MENTDYELTKEIEDEIPIEDEEEYEPPKPTLYLEVLEGGEINSAGTTPINDSSISIEFEGYDELMQILENIVFYRYIDGELVRKSQEEIDEILNEPEPKSEVDELKQIIAQSEQTIEQQFMVLDELLFTIIPEILEKSEEGGEE